MEISVDGWAIGARFSSSHVIPMHQKCGRMHGHSYAVSARFRGEVSESDDMLVDFITVKRAIREICRELDHRVLVPTEHPDLEIEEVGDNLELAIVDKFYSLPKDDVKLLPIPNATAERIAEWFLSELLSRHELLPLVEEVSIGIEEGQGQGAWVTQSLK
jgi:6-pyruvoyltetrahydropterin/6-carboxytetrahydropterin synthase